jgi:hypothetical protein
MFTQHTSRVMTAALAVKRYTQKIADSNGHVGHPAQYNLRRTKPDLELCNHDDLPAKISSLLRVALMP